MIYVGIDDTDTLDSPGTNQLARRIVEALADEYRCHAIVRHQLFFDPRIPYTSKNGSASIWLEPLAQAELSTLPHRLRHLMQQYFVMGSDPGLCIAEEVPAAISDYAERCKRTIITQDEARALAQQAAIFLEGLGGTEGGVIGALAAVGLAKRQNDGRIVQWQQHPDDLTSWQEIATLAVRQVNVRQRSTEEFVTSGMIDVGKHLRPNMVAGAAVLWAEPTELPERWLGLKLVD